MSKQHKVRHSKTGKIHFVNDHTFKHLHWTDFEKIEEPAKPADVKEPTKEDQSQEGNQEQAEQTPTEPQEDLSALNIKQLKERAKDLEGFKHTLNKASLIELIKNS